MGPAVGSEASPAFQVQQGHGHLCPQGTLGHHTRLYSTAVQLKYNVSPLYNLTLSRSHIKTGSNKEMKVILVIYFIPYMQNPFNM